MRNYLLASWLVTFCSSCTMLNSVDINTRLEVESVIASCIAELENIAEYTFLEKVDHIYVDIFAGGYTLSFSHGAIGTFGRRSLDVYTVWACSASNDEVVFLGAPLKNPLIDDVNHYPFENYEEDVTEVLFQRVGDRFKYCCSQKFDKKNIEKHNPDYPWHDNKVS